LEGGGVSAERFEAWGVVSLFGHKTVAGRISEQTIGGETFLRVDVPLSEPDKFHTTLYGKGAIYSMQLTDEPIAREYAKRVDARPVHAYDMNALLTDQRASQESRMFEQHKGLDTDHDGDDDY
jgi:hypothetical protein